ncbi:hypothetical protein BBI11_15660 [Planococcus maritimus]|uniref:DUF3021 domain-containing protein n=1 Tax=Planococcus maritimus TaxID=192421 RepID=UPI00080F160B|nr:DUF3021 domain-containing protein [Planococcus maritimus]ANU18384.1 hypothetical protein BBI11_15660 [Planococcus maritimus]
MKTFLIRSVFGIFFGAFLSVLMTNTVVLSGQETLDGALFLRNSIGSILCGWFFSVSTLYFENHQWSLAKQTTAHFITVIVLYFVLAIGIGWFPFTVPSMLLTIATFVLFYIAIWFAFYFYFKKQARTMNDELNG